jgi:hypothetical protein
MKSMVCHSANAAQIHILSGCHRNRLKTLNRTFNETVRRNISHQNTLPVSDSLQLVNTADEYYMIHVRCECRQRTTRYNVKSHVGRDRMINISQEYTSH